MNNKQVVELHIPGQRYFHAVQNKFHLIPFKSPGNLKIYALIVMTWRLDSWVF